MNTKIIHSIRLDRIIVGERLRGVDPDFAAWIGASMEERGQDTPITVSAPDNEGNHTLIAGGHRVEGAKLIRWTEIEAWIFEGSELQAELLQIEENLARHELNPLDRAVFLARHKAIYQAMHPHAKRGGDRKSDQWRTIGLRSENFGDAIKAKLGLSKATINAAIKVAENLPPDVRAAVAKTAIARSGKELAALARLVPFEQRQVVEVLLQRGSASIVEALRVARNAPLPVADADEQAFSRLLQLWIKAGTKPRQRFVSYLQEGGHLPGQKSKGKRPALQDA